MFKNRILFASGIILLLVIFAFSESQRSTGIEPAFISRQDAYKNKTIMQCSPDWNFLNIDSLANNITILPGWGNYKWDIASKNDSARLYFHQGISMYYSFHIIEAMASFKKAERFDKDNAMIYWAQALAYGPNINDFAYSTAPDALEAAQKAMLLSSNCTPKERALIKAMSVRYSADTSISRESLNQFYTDEMQKAFNLFPDEADMAALYADAMMLQHPWEYWKHNGEAHPWTPAILKVLEKAISIYPAHPGANHYYIHCTEASPTPGLALESAHLLSTLMPSVSHMVHMPSHIYIRSGFYKEGIIVNEMSLKGYKDYLSLFPEVGTNAPLYFIHNLHMQAACAMMGTGYEKSASIAGECRASFDTSFLSIPAPFGYFMQYVYMTPVLNDVRFGKWKNILAAPPIPSNYVYANVLLHWARGMANARLNNLAEAKKELKFIRDNKNETGMMVVLQPFNAPVAAANVAEKFLQGIIAEQEGDFKSAIAFLKEAVKNEDDMIYTEPKDWLLPVRPYLGALYLKAGFNSAAEIIFKEDLKDNPKNHWALKGLYETLKKQMKQTEATLVNMQLDKTIEMNEMKDLPVVY